MRYDFDHSPAALFSLPPEAIAESLASREISPRGPASGLRLLSFYIRHSAKRLSPSRQRSLEKARKLLTDRIEREIRADFRAKSAA